METLTKALPYLAEYSYLGVFLLIVAFSFMPPMSKTLVIVAAGVLAGQGVGNVYLYMIVCVAGLVTVDSLFFFLGYYNRDKVYHWRWFSKPQNRIKLSRAEMHLRQHEFSAIFSARFLPYLRGFIFIVAGLNRMATRRFLAADALSAALVVPVAVFTGYLLGENLDALVATVRGGESVLAMVAIGIVVVIIIVSRILAGRR